MGLLAVIDFDGCRIRKAIIRSGLEYPRQGNRPQEGGVSLRRVFSLLATVIGVMGVYMTQVGPDDAVSNLSKWLGKLAPDWIKPPSADDWGALVFGGILALGLLPLFFSSKPERPSRPIWTSRRWWRRSPIRLFLERDSGSDRLGIQSFPTISYIQVAVSSSRRIERCRAWIVRSEYGVGDGRFAVEHNERLACGWSKPTGKDPLETEIAPNDPTIRFNVLIFNRHGIEHDLGTPTNWHGRLQRAGLHRISVLVVGQCEGRDVSASANLMVDWNGNGDAVLRLLQL
jgi:hypothetical protein